LCGCSEHELLRGEVATVKAAKDKLNSKVVELEEEARRYKEAIEIHKQRTPSEDEVSMISVTWQPVQCCTSKVFSLVIQNAFTSLVLSFFIFILILVLYSLLNVISDLLFMAAALIQCCFNVLIFCFV